MDVLATRALSYMDEMGMQRELTLIVFMPFETTKGQWKCDFAFNPPIYRTEINGGGVDFLHAFLVALKIARIFFESTALAGRVHWQGMHGLGLPERLEKPASFKPEDIPPPEGSAGDRAVLASRRLGYPDEHGVERELLLTLFMPFKTENDEWKCGFTFCPPPDAPVRYGVGVDAIEAILDALAGARAAFEGEAPIDWEGSDDLLDCADLPYKIGRSFFTSPMGAPPPDDPQPSGA